MAIELTVEYKRVNAFVADYTKNISRGTFDLNSTSRSRSGPSSSSSSPCPGSSSRSPSGRVQWIVMPPDATPEQEAGMGIGFVYESEADRAKTAAIVENLMVGSLGPVIFDKLLHKKKRDE